MLSAQAGAQPWGIDQRQPVAESAGGETQINGVFGRGSWIRTNDLQYPKLK